MKRANSTKIDLKIIKFYFNNFDNPRVALVEDKTYHYLKCQCGKERKIKPKSGYTNLFQHIESQHPNYESDFQKSLDLADQIMV